MATINSSVLWTALPRGFTPAGEPRLTAFVSPRVTHNAASPVMLEKVDGFADWPGTLSTLSFRVRIKGGALLAAQPDPDSAPPDPDVWRTVFSPDTTPVASREFQDYAGRRLLSFPVAAVMGLLKRVYSVVAESYPDSFPSNDFLMVSFARELSLILQEPRETRAWLDGLIHQSEDRNKGGRYLDPALVQPQDQDRLAFAQLYRFYDRPRLPNPYKKAPDGAGTPPRPPKPDVDFHGFCGFVGDYPNLLRRLGLAIDVVLPGGAPDLGATGRLRLVVDAPQGPAWATDPKAAPWTDYEVAGPRFLAAAPQGIDLQDGMLAIDQKDRFEVNQLDVDGSAIKLLNVVPSIVESFLHANVLAPDETSLPALRGPAITISRNARDARLFERLDAARTHDTSPPASGLVFTAADVNRGYRLDVEDAGTGRWHSLHQRVGAYSVVTPQGDVPLDIDPDEGYVKGASTASTPLDDDLYLHEALFSWDGWSLAAARPGQPVDSPGVPPAGAPATDFPLRVNFVARRGTLPRLRFGHTYRFRARAVDLAGNSVEDGAVDPARVSEPETLLRWEPVPSPAVVPLRRYSEGESLRTMVIRSTLGVPAAGYVSLPRVTALAGHANPETAYLAANERHLAPPKTSQLMAELHGAFDPGVGEARPAADVEMQYRRAAREQGTFLDVEMVDLADPSIVHALTPEIVNPKGDPPTPLPVTPRGAPLAEGEYLVYPAPNLRLPYLPDWYSHGPALAGLPGHAGPWTQPWMGGWPDLEPIRIRIEEGSGAPLFTPGDRVLTVRLPQAEIATVRLSSALPPGTLPTLGVWSLLSAASQSDPTRSAAATQGGFWMLTPFEDVVLVHAVEKPLSAPMVDVDDGDVDREEGETFAVLEGALVNHSHSTGRLDLEASWKSWVDDPLRDEPHQEAGQGHVCDFNVAYGEAAAQLGRDDAEAPGLKVHRARHEFGDTKHRTVSYTARASTRFRDYFPPEITNDPALITHLGPPKDVSIPSSWRPDPPDVRYIVPTFRWEDSTASDPGSPTVSRTRHGGGLRVYLGRPWFSSGDDELLGVVLLDQPWINPRVPVRPGDLGPVRPASAERLIRVAEPTGLRARRSVELTPQGRTRIDVPSATILVPKLKTSKWVTQWGMDPIWGSRVPAPGPLVSQFPLGTHVGTGLSLAEVTGGKVTVVGHQPWFDKSRKLWACDLEVEAGTSYFPFVRLALVRYQPSSIAGVHISRVVLAEFVQLVPDRTASLFRVDRGVARVRVSGVAGFTDLAETVVGPGQAGSGPGMQWSRTLVVRVERRTKGADDLAWQPVADWQRMGAGGPDLQGDYEWWGSVEIPMPKAKEELRVVVREYELHRADRSVAEEDLERELGPARRRLVYADELPL